MSNLIDLVTAADVIQAVPRLQGYPDLADLITDVSDAVIVHCGQAFNLTGYTEVYDGGDQPRLWLRHLPVLVVSSVTIEGNAVDNSLGDGWTFNPATGELRRGNGQQEAQFEAWFPFGMQNVVVSYTAGAYPIPRSVRRAVIFTVKHWVDATKHTGVFSKEELGDYRYELAEVQVKLPDIARDLLVPFCPDLIG